ncbi:MAG: aldo/keto reductase [Oscillospiraceae bacterium]|jgi:aryl-alcohol dehydrogenase-like predicted oxidoreductase/NAD-dependent dihydropyrimidine dehydrogenase PreA subunit|nr:aldo/keto reductase [Oscillospiraceae bacterium]
MTNRLLGKTGLAVSPLCYGTLPFSPLQSYTGGGAATDALTRAFELGVNFLDTAQLYDNYSILRPALAKAGRDVFVASKTYAVSREEALQAVEEARSALGRDVIDIFLLHEQESEHTLRGHAAALEALYDCKAKGIVRAVGLSTHRPEGVLAAMSAGLDVVHPLLNIAGLGLPPPGRSAMENAIRSAEGAGLGVYTMKALGGGHLWRSAEEALAYARQYGHSLALGMRDVSEVGAAVTFFETGALPRLTGNKSRSLHIATWCTGCGQCVAACPNDALEVVDCKAQLRENDLCVLCGYCGAACPEFCIKVI